MKLPLVPFFAIVSAPLLCASLASAATYVPMGTISGPGSAAKGGNNPAVPDPTLDASTAFDLRGLFLVTSGTSAMGYTTQLTATGTLSDITAGIYSDGGGGAPGTLIANIPVAYSSANIWVLHSPVAFALDPGSYIFQVLGSKQAGAVLQYQLAVTAVPLPATALTFGAGLAGIGLFATRRRRAAA